MNGAAAKKIRKEAVRVSEKLTPAIFKSIHDKSQEKTNEEIAIADGAEFFDPSDASGGDYDDAYSMGIDTGAIIYARVLLAEIKQQSAEAVV